MEEIMVEMVFLSSARAITRNKNSMQNRLLECEQHGKSLKTILYHDDLPIKHMYVVVNLKNKRAGSEAECYGFLP